MSEFPKEYQTNKNLRYWLSNRPDEGICSSPDDFFLHETEVVEFAKQFNREEIQHLESELKKRDELLEEALVIINSVSGLDDGYFDNSSLGEEAKEFLDKPEIKTILESTDERPICL